MDSLNSVFVVESCCNPVLQEGSRWNLVPVGVLVEPGAGGGVLVILGVSRGILVKPGARGMVLLSPGVTRRLLMEPGVCGVLVKPGAGKGSSWKGLVVILVGS